MENNNFQIEGFTIAVTSMEKMVNFYQGVFEIKFKKVPKYGTILYEGSFAEMKILMCPAAIANNEAKQNRHQFDIIVQNMDVYPKKIVENGGALIGDVIENDHSNSLGIKDPDGNSMVLIEYK